MLIFVRLQQNKVNPKLTLILGRLNGAYDTGILSKYLMAAVA